MKTGTHNLGRNAVGKLALVRIDKDGLRLQVGGDSVLLTHEQGHLLKEALS